jgi:hypothetical protein
MIDQGRDIPPEELRRKIGHHRVADLALAHQGTVDEPAAIGVMVHHALFLHLGQHGGNGGEGKPPFRLERLVNLGHRRLPVNPQDPHDGEL